MRGPTADEMRAEIAQATGHGAAGIFYFPDVIGRGWESFDGTTPELAAAMTAADAAINPVPATQPATSPATKPANSFDATITKNADGTYTVTPKH
jgi:hypothetical protein